MISTPDRQNAIALIEQAKAAGARRAQACAELGIDERTCRRWRAMDGAPRDRRPTAPRPAPRNRLSEQARQAVLDICNSEPFESLPPSQIVPRLAAATLAAVALAAPWMSDWALAWAFGLAGAGIGCSYPVSQITVQVAGGPGRLGAAAASVQYARTLGAAVGTTLLGGVLFGALAAGEPLVAELFARLVREGAALLPTLQEASRLALRQGLSDAFRLGFLVAAALAACGSYLAWRVPVRRV